MLQQRCRKKTGNNFGIPCYGHKIFIPSNKSLIMKKNLPFYLIVLFTVFGGIPDNMAYQSHSFHCKTYRFNNNVQKRSGNVFENLIVKQTSEINAISCDHSHKFLDNLINYEYKKSYDFIADQAGRPGIISERLDFESTKFWGRNLANYHTISVSQKTEG
jgi:hypothetical protein